LEEREGVLYETHSQAKVAFIHFSGFSTENPDRICNYPLRNPFSRHLSTKRVSLKDRPDLGGAFRLYLQFLLACDVEKFSRCSYGYAKYDNGEPISQLERSLYLASASWRESPLDPFVTGPRSFHNACRQAGIRADTRTLLKPSAAEIVDTYRLHILLIQFLLRFLLRCLGPVRYLEFAKFMRSQFLPVNQGFLLSQKRATQSVYSNVTTVSSEAQPE
jgi:hypothetical protein